jgi:hypothetical protein
MRSSFELHMIKYDALYIYTSRYVLPPFTKYDTGKEGLYLLSSSFFFRVGDEEKEGGSGVVVSFFEGAPDDFSDSRSNLTPLQTDRVFQRKNNHQPSQQVGSLLDNQSIHSCHNRRLIATDSINYRCSDTLLTTYYTRLRYLPPVPRNLSVFPSP